MPYMLRMPEVAANATHATLVCWNMAEGDQIEAGQSIADVETDKAVLELPVEQTATVGKLLVANGTQVAVGEPIAVLLQPGESLTDAPLSEGADDAASVAAAPDRSVAKASAPTGTEVAAPQASPSAPAHSSERANGRRFSSPAARLLAKQHDLDLIHVTGSGPRGRVTKHDVVTHLQSNTVPAPRPAATTAQTSDKAFTVTTPSATRQTIARRLSQSKSEVPHFYLRARCNVQSLLAVRKQINEQRQPPVSINDLVIRAAAVALVQVPELNVSWRDDGIHQFEQVDVSVAVDTPNGLMTPIVFDAANKTLTAISDDIRALAKTARLGRLQPQQFQGGTFSVSNLGMYGVDNFDAIINPPQAGILAVGGVQSVAVVRDGDVVAGQVMDVVLSVDHRVVDGAAAARWLAAFRRLIENPLTLLI